MSDPLSDLTLNGPRDLVEAIPYFLGLVPPPDSIVLVCFDGDRLTRVAHIEVPDGDAVSLPLDPLIAAAGSLVIVGYGGRRDMSVPLAVLSASLQAAGVRVDDALRVEGERFWSLDDGLGQRFDWRSSAVATALLALGVAPPRT
ncbi:hypothetical protein Afil01_31340 [Actinorhabdospora filicis]|uniref:Uncharacterized protein n=1 Tax=Actinorhabdospora filicis TaxID=1785913 RepID=A0A9W6SLW8_9ACTN|nr:DUF4192 family protein [Actinorhabdospora filicis]GLZ78327.1 hypothetical protein Afil01_31340 [Actinorhabdospora filicis]